MAGISDTQARNLRVKRQPANTSEKWDAKVQKAHDAAEAFRAHADAKEKGIIKGVGGASQVECLVCTGTIRYSVAAVNGHMWGRCSTPGCLVWME